MGGSAFKNINVSRIKAEDISNTLAYFVKQVNYPGFDHSYAMANLLGSAGKQADSGDLDVAVDNVLFPWKKFKEHALLSFPEKQRAGNGKNTLQVNFAVPINGDPNNGFCQVDLITGDPEWLKFTHYSPGAASAYKGVYLSTLIGVLAKMSIGYMVGESSENATAKVSWAYDLERGLRRRWMIVDDRNLYVEVDADRWESQLGYLMDQGRVPKGPTPRFSRVGYITNPEEVVRILFQEKLRKDEMTDFEIAFNVAKTLVDPVQLAERLVEALSRSGLKASKTKEEIHQSIQMLL